MDPEYTAHSYETPANLISQFPLIDGLVEAFGIENIRVPGVEADDVMGTLARHAEAEGLDTVLVTADKDFGELAFRRGLFADSGIILLRIRGSAETRTATLVAAVQAREDWAGQFTVVENDRIRMTPLSRRA